MSFLEPWVLLALPAVAAWAAWEWTRTRRHTALLLKVLMAALVVVALARPRLTVFEKRVDVALLADTSASVPAEELKKESEWITRLRDQRGRHTLRVIPFADGARNLRPEEDRGRIDLQQEGRATNLETAIRNGIAALREGRVPRDRKSVV